MFPPKGANGLQFIDHLLCDNQIQMIVFDERTMPDLNRRFQVRWP